ncbi:MAG: hypothetical protein R3C12_05275 [Planctomycetaceae bacterium]
MLKKHYGSRLASCDFDVLDTLLFAICLEDASFEQARQALTRFKEGFFDYNEARVSSITELQHVLGNLSHADWKALRIRESLQVVFEGRYSFELEDLKKKSLEAAEKFLQKISTLTPFAISHTLLATFGAHLVPMDNQMLNTCLWLSLLEEGTDLSHASDSFKSAIRKADVPLFYNLIKQLANDPAFAPLLKQSNSAKTENPVDNITHAVDYLKQLLSGQMPASKGKTTKGSAAPAPAPNKKTAKKSTEKTKNVDKPVAKKTSKKSPTKPEGKKAPPKKTAKPGKKTAPPVKKKTKSAKK